MLETFRANVLLVLIQCTESANRQGKPNYGTLLNQSYTYDGPTYLSTVIYNYKNAADIVTDFSAIDPLLFSVFTCVLILSHIFVSLNSIKIQSWIQSLNTKCAMASNC